MKVAVCDDERRVRDEMREWIEAFPDAACDVVCYDSGEALCKAKIRFDLIFLDIDMDGMDGIEAARWIRKKDKKVRIIYVTSYQEYINGAFAVHAFAYLLKPVTKEKIFEQMREVLDYQPKERKSPILDFVTDSGLERLAADELYYFEYLNRKIYLHTSRGTFTYGGRISDVEKKMTAYGFAVPHKSFVVNLYHVKSVKGYDIRMMNGAEIPLSQKKSREFRGMLSEFLEQMLEGTL